MKTLLKFFAAVVGLFLAIGPVSTVLAQTLNISAGSATGLAVGSLVVLASPVFRMAVLPNVFRADVTPEIWVSYIMERFWKDNLFIKHAFSDDDKVIGGKIVHIPQPGALPTVVKNRTSFPAATVRRSDTDVVYVLDEYSTDPTHIQDAEKVELSYDKIDSVLGDHLGVITETAGDDMILKWLNNIPAGNILRTTGAGAAATLVGATGNRKVFTHDDLRKAKLAMDLQKAPKTDRYALLDSNMADQLFQSLSNTQYRDFSQYADATTGVIGKLYGFNIMDRTNVAAASSALAIKALGSANATTDHAVSMCWQKNAVARALGEVKFFEKINDPQFYGDVYSSLLRAGGRRRREDNAGVVAIVQDTAS